MTQRTFAGNPGTVVLFAGSLALLRLAFALLLPGSGDGGSARERPYPRPGRTRSVGVQPVAQFLQRARQQTGDVHLGDPGSGGDLRLAPALEEP